jgi:DNA-binding NarL/FixJ family response regulator
MNTSIAVFYAERHTMFRIGIRELLAKEPDIKYVGESDTFEDLFRTLDETPPDILLIDHKLLDGQTIDNIDFIRYNHPNLKVIMLTICYGTDFMLRFIGKIDAFIGKNIESNKIAGVIRKVYSGETYFTVPCDATFR